jgi:ABC-2 type transport system permease protein
VALAFLALLALALWQKLRDRIPYLLDPTAQAPASVDLSDALLVVVAFFVAQLLFGLALAPIDLDPMERACAAFAVAGACVVGGALYTFRRFGIRDVLATTALRHPARRGRAALALVLAPALGVALGAAAVAYRHAIEHVLPIDVATRAAAESIPVGDARWFVITAVASAPVFEEIIFRGIMFRSLRRAWPRWASVLASAGAFAACHPPLAMAPVFVMGACAALLVEWSSWVAPAVLLHTAYNAAVLSGVWERVLGP